MRVDIWYNSGLCAVYNGDTNGGVADMRTASGAKVTPEHGVIDEAIQDQGDGYTVFSVVRPFFSTLDPVSHTPMLFFVNSPLEPSTVLPNRR